MAAPDLSRGQWRKSYRSNQQGGACVEVAFVDQVVAVRDSKNPDGPKLIISREAWRTFSIAVDQGSFDLH